MKKTIMQLNKEFVEIMAANGFKVIGTDYSGKTLYSRKWKRTTYVASYGETVSTYEIIASISYGCLILQFYQDEVRIARRDYNSPKSALNAMKEIVKSAGHQF